MATFRDSSANSKHASKIPKRMPVSPSRRSNQLSQLSSESTMSNLTDSSTKTNPQRIFEATKLNSACDFLSHLQSKLQNDVNKDQKTSVVVSNSSGSNKLSEQNDKMSGIVSSILDTLKDISENFPLISQEDHKDTISQLLDLRRTSSLLSHTEKCFFLSQHFTVNHLQQDLSGGHSNKRSDKADQEKLIMDKQLLQQLADLQLLLQDTIAKLEDKGTFTQEDDIKSVNYEASDATSKACKAKCAKKFSKFKRQAPPEPQVQVGYEAKPSPEKDKLHIPQVKRLLEILQSPEIRPFLENKLTAPDSHLLLCACHSAIPTPPNTEVTKTESEATKPDDKLDSTFLFPAIDDVTTPELSDDDAYPAEYKCCLCYGEDEVEPQKPSSPYAIFHDFGDPAKSPLDQETPPILPPPSPFSGSDAKGDEESLYKSGSPKVSPAVQPPKVEKEPIIPIKSSSIDSKTSPENLKSPKGSVKNGDKMSPKGSVSPKSVKSVEEEGASAKKGDKISPKGFSSPKSVKSIDGANNEPKKSLCKARCAPFKCLERTFKHPSEKSPEKSPEPSRKSSVKSKFLFPRKKSIATEEESKKPKDKQDKSKKSGKQDGTDKGNKGSPKEKAQVEEEHPPQDLTPAPIILTAMTPTNAEVSKPTSQDTYHQMAGDIPSPVSVTPVPVEEDIPIPPPPTFDYDSYIGVEPAGEDSFASFVRCQEEAAKAHNKTANTSLTSTAVAKSVIYGNEKPFTVFQVISNPSIKSKENVKSPFKTTENNSGNETPIFTEGSTIQQIPLPIITSDVVASKSQVTNGGLSSPFTPTFPADLNLEKGKSNKALKKAVSIQEYSLEPKQVNRGSGGSKSMVTDASQATSNNRITLNYSVQVVPSFWDGKGTKKSTSTTPPGKSLERVLMKSKSVSIVLPKSQSAVISQISYEEPPTVSKIIPHGTTVFTAMSKSPSMVNIGTGEARRYSASSANFLNKRVTPRLSDPNIARLACRHCMCTMGGPPIEKRMSDKETEVDRVDKLNEFEFLDNGSPPRYFEQVIQEIDMMRNCIEFALNNQLNVHDKIKAYLDDGTEVKSKYPHFHTVVDGIPIILIWKEDPGHMFKHMKRKKSKVLDSTIWRKSKSSLSKKGLRKPHVKGSSAGEKFSSSTGPRHFDKKGSYKSKLLLENLANTMAKYRGKKKHPYKCDECGARCPGKYDKFTHSCSTPPATGVQRKSSSHSNVDRKGRRKSSSPESGTHSPLRKRSKGSLTPKTSKGEGFRSRTKSPEGSPSRKKSQGGGSPTRKKSQLGGYLSGKKSQEAPSSVGCFCDDEPDQKERDNLKRRYSSRTASFPKLLKCKSIKTLFGSADEECCEKQKCPTRNHSMHKGKRIFPRNKSTNVPSNSDSTSMQTYYLTARQPKVSKESTSKNRGDSESDNDMPYLIDVQSLPQFEHPETVCSSKLFDVKQVDCELRNEIKTGNKNVKDTLLRINLNALLDSFKPAKCCKKMVINGRTRSTYPYPASLQSLPLSEEDLDRILEIMQNRD